MKYSEIVDRNATETEIRAFLIEGAQTAVTFRIPENLHEAAKEAASLRGMSFSAFIRTCMIDELAEK